LRRPSRKRDEGNGNGQAEKAEFRLKLLTAILSCLTVAAALFAGFQAYLNYRQQATLQATRALHADQRRICMSLVGVASKMFSAYDPEELLLLHDQFAEIKHGEALVYLDKDTIELAVAVYNRSIDALKVDEGDGFRKGVQCALAEHPFKLALACRKLVSDAFVREAGLPLNLIETSYVMEWKGECGK
jgi:uncharacterized protein HemX